MSRADEPAYPLARQRATTRIHNSDGMTIRERMAMAAMQGLASASHASGPEWAASQSVCYADALLAALEAKR